MFFFEFLDILHASMASAGIDGLSECVNDMDVNSFSECGGNL